MFKMKINHLMFPQHFCFPPKTSYYLPRCTCGCLHRLPAQLSVADMISGVISSPLKHKCGKAALECGKCVKGMCLCTENKKP